MNTILSGSANHKLFKTTGHMSKVRKFFSSVFGCNGKKYTIKSKLHKNIDICGTSAKGNVKDGCDGIFTSTVKPQQKREGPLQDNHDNESQVSICHMNPPKNESKQNELVSSPKTLTSTVSSDDQSWHDSSFRRRKIGRSYSHRNEPKYSPLLPVATRKKVEKSLSFCHAPLHRSRHMAKEEKSVRPEFSDESISSREDKRRQSPRLTSGEAVFSFLTEAKAKRKSVEKSYSFCHAPLHRIRPMVKGDHRRQSTAIISSEEESPFCFSKRYRKTSSECVGNSSLHTDVLEPENGDAMEGSDMERLPLVKQMVRKISSPARLCRVFSFNEHKNSDPGPVCQQTTETESLTPGIIIHKTSDPMANSRGACTSRAEDTGVPTMARYRRLQSCCPIMLSSMPSDQTEQQFETPFSDSPIYPGRMLSSTKKRKIYEKSLSMSSSPKSFQRKLNANTDKRSWSQLVSGNVDIPFCIPPRYSRERPVMGADSAGSERLRLLSFGSYFRNRLDNYHCKANGNKGKFLYRPKLRASAELEHFLIQKKLSQTHETFMKAGL